MAVLQYDFRAINENVVGRALTSIEARVARHNAIMARQFGGSTVARPGGATTSAHAARARASGSNAAAAAEAKAAAQAERYWRTAHQRSTDHRIRAEERAHRARIRQIEKESAVQRRATEREAAERRRAAASLDRQRHAALVAQGRAAERHAMMAGRGRQRVLGSALGVAGRSVGGSLSTVGRTASLAIGLGGTFAVANALQTQIAESARASQLANQAGSPEIKGELLRESQGIKGFTGMEALEGLGAFVDVTGDLASARSMLGDMSQVALATSTDLTDLAGAMATAFVPLSDAIQDPAERLKALNKVMRATAGMGAIGAVEVKDLASEMAGLAAASGRFTGDSERNLNMMVAMAQAARQRGGAGSAAEAVKGVQRFTSDVIGTSGQKRLKGLGVDVFADKSRTALKDPTEIIVEVLQKTKGDLTKLTAIFGERGIKAVQGFSPLFTKAEAANAALPEGQRRKAGEAGADVVRAEMGRFLAAAVSETDVKKRVASTLAEPDKQLLEATKKFNAAVGSELLPVLIRLIPEFTKLIPSVANAAKFMAELVEKFAKDPVGSIFKIIALKLALDLAAAGIGGAVRGALMRAVGGAAVGGAAGGVVPAGGKGKLGGAVPALAATAALVGVGAAVDQGTDLSKQSGGFEGVLAGIGSFLSGEGFAKGVDMHMSNRARAKHDAANPFEQDRQERGFHAAMLGRRAGLSPETIADLMAGNAKLPEGMAAQNERGERVSFKQLSAEQQVALLKSAEALAKSAAALDKSAAALTNAGPNRGNTPDPGNPTKT